MSRTEVIAHLSRELDSVRDRLRAEADAGDETDPADADDPVPDPDETDAHYVEALVGFGRPALDGFVDLDIVDNNWFDPFDVSTVRANDDPLNRPLEVGVRLRIVCEHYHPDVGDTAYDIVGDLDIIESNTDEPVVYAIPITSDLEAGVVGIDTVYAIDIDKQKFRKGTVSHVPRYDDGELSITHPIHTHREWRPIQTLQRVDNAVSTISARRHQRPRL